MVHNIGDRVSFLMPYAGGSFDAKQVAARDAGKLPSTKKVGGSIDAIAGDVLTVRLQLGGFVKVKAAEVVNHSAK